MHSDNHNGATNATPPADGTAADTSRNRLPRRSGHSIACGWCGAAVLVLSRGRPPKWCSPACRHRAWEQTRAAESGRSAVEVVTQILEVERPVIVPEHVEVETQPTGAGWSVALTELARQIDAGRVYDRDLRDLAVSLDLVLSALSRRPVWKRLMSRR